MLESVQVFVQSSCPLIRCIAVLYRVLSLITSLIIIKGLDDVLAVRTEYECCMPMFIASPVGLA